MGVCLLVGVLLSAQSWSAVVEPGEVTSGTRSAQIRLAGPRLVPSDLELHTHVGHLSPLTQEGTSWVATWHLPPSLPPQRTTVLVLHRPTGTVQLAQLAVTRRLSLNTRSRPGATIVARLDGKEVARAQTSDEGTVTLTVDVPPDALGNLELEHLQNKKVIHRESSKIRVGAALEAWAVQPQGGTSIYVVAEGPNARSEDPVLVATLEGTPLSPTKVAQGAWRLSLPEGGAGTLQADLRVGKKNARTTMQVIQNAAPHRGGHRFWVGPYAGIAVDFDGLGAAVVGANVGWRPLSTVAIWLDFAALPGSSTRLTGQQGMAQTLTDELQGLTLTTVGGAWIVNPWPRASVLLGAQTGWAASFSKVRRTGPQGQINSQGKRTEHAWAGGLLTQVLLHTSLGDVALGPQLLVIPGTLAGLEAPVTTVSLHAGFRFGIGAR